MLVIGLVVIAWGLLLWYIIRYPIWFTVPIGFFNIVLGIITPKSRKFELQPQQSDSVKLVVDQVLFRRGRWVGRYELVLLDNKLVMKKLTSWRVILPAGFVFVLFGAIIGGITLVSVQEFLDQRRRDKIRDMNDFATAARGDLEILYASMSQVQLDGVSLKMVVGGRPLELNLPLDYSPLIPQRIKEVIPAQCWIHPY
jgi:hypothetical protein